MFFNILSWENRWKTEENRTPLHGVITEIFPILVEIGSSLVRLDSLEAAEMLKTILKTYYISIQVRN